MEGAITLFFDVHINKKYGLKKQVIPTLTVERRTPARLRDITGHLETHLGLPDGSARRLLLQAICTKDPKKQSAPSSSSSQNNNTMPISTWNPSGVVPLVCNQIWSSILTGYPQRRLKVLVNREIPYVDAHKTSCLSMFENHELKLLDTAAYIPTRNLKSKNIMELCRNIFENGMKVKPELRKGVWMHLLGVFHPNLEAREDREAYFNNLRRVYDHLKGKWIGAEEDTNDERKQLIDAVHRDAIRTDPSHPFYARSRPVDTSLRNRGLDPNAEENNILKLVNIIVIYTLEHSGISYTQGMTDILSPILYVMNHEADAYVCFAAMLERINYNFGEWCEGTLHKLERLRHICEVLDPQLFSYLTENIEEDAFALFFGMVLIECRREFSFEESFHLLESIWSGVACMKDSLPRSSRLTHSEWAAYMTYESKEVLQQVFGETGVPYTAVPLPRTMSDNYSIVGQYRSAYSRNPSFLSQSPPPPTPHSQQQQQQYVPSVSRPSRYSQDHVIPEHPPAVSTSPISINNSDTSDELLDSRVRSHRPILNQTVVFIENHTTEERPHLQLPPDQPPEGRQRSQSDPNVQNASSATCIAGNSSPCSDKLSVTTIKQDTVSATNSNLGNSSLCHSHSESELYDTFSSSKVPATGKQQQNPIGKAQTELSDMSSISSGVSANGNLLSSLKSIDSRGKNGTPHGRNITPDSADIGSARNSEPPGKECGSASPSFSSEFKTTPIPDGFERETRGSPPMQKRETFQSNPVPHRITTPVDRMDGPSPIATSVQDSDQPQLQANGVHDGRIVLTKVGIHSNSPMFSYRGSTKTAVTTDTDTDDNTPSSRRKFKTKKQSQIRPKRTRKQVEGMSDHTGTSTPVYTDDDRVPSSSRVTPVAFFDAIEQIASSVPSRGSSNPAITSPIHGILLGAESEAESTGVEDTDDDEDPVHTYRNARRDSRANSEISMIVSQLISVDQAAPRITRERSLSVCVSDCYSLFICLAILIQNRLQIMNNSEDFYGLSRILNTQAGSQDLETTLRMARHLYRTYRRYQTMCIGIGPRDLNTWLDDTGVGRPEDERDDQNEEQNRRTGRERSRCRTTSDSVFSDS